MNTVSVKWLLVLMILTAFCFLSNDGLGQYTKEDSIAIHQLYNASRKYWRKNSDSAIYFLRQVEDQSKQVGYRRGEAYALYAIGFNESMLFKSFQCYTQSFSIFESLQDQFGMGLTLLRIGVVYSRIGQDEKALEYYERALRVKKKLDDYGGVALTLINIGHYYQDKGLFERALDYFTEALMYRLKEGTHQGKAYAQVNIGDALFSLNRFDESLTMADSAIHNFSFTSDVEGQVWSLQLKGQNLKKSGDLKGAAKAFEQILQYGEKARFLYPMLYARRELIEMYASRGDAKRAFEIQSEYLIAKDTLDKRENRTETLRLVNEYEFKLSQQKAEREKQLQDAKIARRNNLEHLSIAIIVLLIFVILFSGRKKLSTKIVNISLLIGLLLLFEFLLILTDSSVEKITQGEPILKLLANVLLALLILPGHQFLERYSRKRLIQQ